MRDAHRMKEKVQLTLDDRQVAGIVVGSLVALGVVFVIGVVVGKGMNPGLEQAPPDDLLAALDRRADSKLTYPEALTGPEGGEQPRVARSAGNIKVIKEGRSAPSLPATPPPAKAEPASASSDDRAGAVKLAKAIRSAEQAPASAPRAAQEPAVEVAVAKRPVTTESTPTRTTLPPSPEPTPTQVSAKRLLQEALANATESEGPKPVPVEAAGEYTLQLSASQAEAEANRFAEKLSDRGYSPYVIRSEVPGKGVWYRVRMGRFASVDQAKRYMADLKREAGVAAYVAKIE